MKLSRQGRAAVVTVHVAAATAWTALITATTAMQAASPSRTDPVVISPLLRYQILFPIIMIAIVSGIILSTGTVYGFLKHRWLVGKLILTTVLMVLGTIAIVSQLTDLWLRILILVLLIVISAISTAKPFGRTRRWRRRPQHER